MSYAEKLTAIKARLREMQERAERATPARWGLMPNGSLFAGHERLLPWNALAPDNMAFIAYSRTDLPALVGWALEMVAEWKTPPEPVLRRGGSVRVPRAQDIDSLARALGIPGIEDRG